MKFILQILIPTIIFSQSIAFVGDSITKSGYNEIIQNEIPNYTTYNFGVNGITVANSNFNYRNTEEFEQILIMEPDNIVIMLGTNDIRYYNALGEEWGSVWEYEYKWLIKKFSKFSKVLLCTIPYQLRSASTYATIDKLNGKIFNIANEFILEVADINFALGSNPKFFKEDGVHLTSEGKLIIAKEILAHLTPEYLERDAEYWESVQEYDKQKRIGWFGCQP